MKPEDWVIPLIILSSLIEVNYIGKNLFSLLVPRDRWSLTGWKLLQKTEVSQLAIIDRSWPTFFYLYLLGWVSLLPTTKLLLNINLSDDHVKLRVPLTETKLGPDVALHQIHPMLLLAPTCLLDFPVNNREQGGSVTRFGGFSRLWRLGQIFLILWVSLQDFKLAAIDISDELGILVLLVKTFINHLANIKCQVPPLGLFLLSLHHILVYEAFLELNDWLISVLLFLYLLLLLYGLKGVVINQEFTLLVCGSLVEWLELWLATLLLPVFPRHSHWENRICIGRCRAIGGASINWLSCFRLHQTVSIHLFPIPVVNVDPPLRFRCVTLLRA